MATSEKSDSKTLPWIVFGLVILAVGIFVMVGAGSLNNPSGVSGAASTETAPLVDIIKAAPASADYKIRVPGRFRSRQSVSIVGEIAGKVIDINPKLVVGGRVEAGETLLTINPVDFEAELARSRAAVSSARAELERSRLNNERQTELTGTGAASKAALDTAVANLASAEAAVAQAEAQVRLAEENLKRTVIKAPFPALVASENLSLDSYVSPGQQLAVLIDARLGELVAGLSPRAAAAVARLLAETTGDRLPAIARPNEGSVGSVSLTGYVENFSPTIDQSSRSALVVAVFPDAFSRQYEGRIFSDDFMTLEIDATADTKVWEIPYGAVRRDQYVWIVDSENRLVKAAVSIIRGDEQMAIVSSPLDLGQADIMLTILSEEREGLMVKPQRSPTPQTPDETR